MSSADVKVASVSGNGSGSVLASFLRTAFEFGKLTRLGTLSREDGQRWIEFKYRSHDGEAGESIRAAIDESCNVVGAERWYTSAGFAGSSFSYIETLQERLRLVHSVESLRQAIITSEGELVALSLSFSQGAPFLLAKMKGDVL